MFVAALPPWGYLIGLILIYTSMLMGGLRIFSVFLDMPSVKTLWHVGQTQYMKKKIIKNGGAISNISTSSSLAPNGVANVKTP